MKKLTSIFLLSATMILASCGGKPADSKPVDSASTPAESTTSQTSSNAGTSTTSQAPATSTTSQAPAASSSSQAPAASSSSQAPASSSEQEQKSIAYTSGGIVKENDKIYVKVGGTIAGYTAAEAKMAFGLQHKANADSGLADAHDGEWLVGSETPAATDFTITPTITGTTFEVKVEVTNVAFTEGAYAIYLGTADSYARVTMQQSQWEAGSKIKTGNVRIIMRGDASLISAEAMPGLIVTESTIVLETVEDVQKPFLKIGGEFGAMDKDAFEAAQIAVRLERQLNGGWTKVDFTGDKVVKLVEENDTKGYLKLDLSSVQEGGYQVKISYNNGAAYPNTDMECASFDARGTANAKVVGTKEYAPYFDAEHNDVNHLYACAGLFVTHVHSMNRGEEKEGTSDLWKVTCPSNDLTYYEMDVTAANCSNLGNENKLNSGKIATFDITGLPAGNYEVYVKGHVSNGSHGPTATVGFSTGDQMSTAGSGTGGTAVPGRYYAQVGDTGEKVYTNTGSKNFNAIGLDDYKTFKWSTEAVIKSMMIPADSTSFKFAHTGAGYSLYCETIRLVRIGDYVPNLKNVVFEQGEMKIEAEDYSIKHTIFTSGRSAGEETDYTTNGQQYPVSLNGTIEEDEEASGGQYIHAVFREGWNNSKSSNMSGELVYGVKLNAETTFKIKAKIKSDMEVSKPCFDVKVNGTLKETINATNVWADVETAAITLPAGIHTISFVGQQLGSSEGYRSVLADIDCFTLVEQQAAE
ncbi:MAG: hypothetical protein MJ228_06110 [Bacilli bacterium]|nr:hypothetical protein [Bacilli bacterium]